MNEKASVSKELNAKHIKILEGLLKLPENRECADCKTKGCSGIHRSLGVHITKVRSTTLDTWLPEQISIIQSMGNEKSCSYWEAELPPNYDRVGIDNFIRAKYLEERWVSKNGKARSPSRVNAEKASVPGPELRSNSQGQVYNVNHVSHSNKVTHPPVTSGSSPASRNCTPALVKEFQQQNPPQNLEPAVSKTEEAKKEGITTSVSKPQKVDYSTELFHLLCMDDSGGNESEPPRNDFSNAASALPLHQELPMLHLHEPYPVTSSTHSAVRYQHVPTAVQKLSPSLGNLYMPNRGSTGHPVTAMVGNGQCTYVAGNQMSLPVSGMHTPTPANVAPMHHVTNLKPTMPPPALSVTPTQPPGHYDLSSLTQGMLAKR